MKVGEREKPFFGKHKYSTKKLIRELAEHPNVLDALKKYPPSKTLGLFSRNPVNEYLKEMVPVPSTVVVRWAARVLKTLWYRVFNGIEIQGLSELREQAEGKHLIYLPCHRSHFDYLLLSYVFYQHYMELPHIIAGNNLNISGVGKILKGGGAIFMRRVIKSNPLYATVFITYINYLLDNNIPLEIFIEGGRSRTGKNLPPKIGFISILTEYLLRRPEKDIHFVPVSVTYERLPEERAYIKELEGAPKQRENLIEFFNAFKVLKKNFGKVFVSFAPPMSLRGMINDYMEKNQKESPSEADQSAMIGDDAGAFEKDPKIKTAEFKNMVYSFGMEVMDQINVHTRISALPIVATALLSEWHRGFHKNELLEKSHFLLDVYKAVHPRASDTLVDSEGGLAGIIDFLIQGGTVRHIKDPDGDIYYFNLKDKIRLNLYKNILVHHFVIPSIIALKIRQGVKTKEQFLDQILFFDNLLRYEFMFPQSYDFQEAIDSMLEFSLKRGLIMEKEEEYFSNPEKEARLNILANIIRPFLDSFKVAINVVTSRKAGFPVEVQKLLSVFRETHHKLLLLGKIFTIEGNLTVSYKNIIRFFDEEKILTSRMEKKKTIINKGEDFDKIHKLDKRLFAKVLPYLPEH